jgi:hypothetical protein
VYGDRMDNLLDGYESEEERSADSAAYDDWVRENGITYTPSWRVLRMDEETTAVLNDFLERRLPGYTPGDPIAISVATYDEVGETGIDNEKVYYLIDSDAEEDPETAHLEV